MTMPRVLLPAVITSLLAMVACSSDIQVGSSNLHILGTDVEISPAGHGRAVVRADGQLLIDGASVAVPDVAKTHLQAYNSAVRAMRQHGIDTGRAGADVAASAATEVTKGLTSGDTSQIGAKIEAKADAVRDRAREICVDLANARKEQDAIAAAVESFRPYAVIKADEAEHCGR